MKKSIILAAVAALLLLPSCKNLPLSGLKADGSGVSYAGTAGNYNYTVTVVPKSGKNPVRSGE